MLHLGKKTRGGYALLAAVGVFSIPVLLTACANSTAAPTPPAAAAPANTATKSAAPAAANSATKGEVRASKNMEIATFAGGCFWSLDAMFNQVRGVYKAEPGYAGGSTAKPSYEQVTTGTTGHAETVNITFDPKVVSYRDLLQIYFGVHDPTTLNRQKNDVGTQYRSAIFYRNAEQKKAAEEVIAKLNADKVFKNPIVTVVTPYTKFYRAEDYHLDYFNKHPTEGYCKYVVAGEVSDFKEKFKDKLKAP